MTDVIILRDDGCHTLKMFPVSKNHFNNNLFISNHTPLIRNIIHNQQFFIIPVNFDNVNFEILEKNKINYFPSEQYLLFQQYNVTRENLLIETNKTSLDNLQQGIFYTTTTRKEIQ